MSIKISGLGALKAQLEELSEQLQVKALAQAARRAMKPVLESAKAMVPVKEGGLRDSLRLSTNKPSRGETVARAGIKIAGGPKGSGDLPPARRWHFIELGTAHSAPHPYLRPALIANSEAVVELFKQELAKAIVRVAKRSKR